MAWPQLIMLSLMCLGIGSSLAKYGRQKTDRYDLMDVLIAPAITFCLLYWGGFFDPLFKSSQ